MPLQRRSLWGFVLIGWVAMESAACLPEPVVLSLRKNQQIELSPLATLNLDGVAACPQLQEVRYESGQPFKGLKVEANPASFEPVHPVRRWFRGDPYRAVSHPNRLAVNLTEVGSRNYPLILIATVQEGKTIYRLRLVYKEEPLLKRTDAMEAAGGGCSQAKITDWVE